MGYSWSTYHNSSSEIIHLCVLRLPNIVYDFDCRVDETRLGNYLHIFISRLWWICMGQILYKPFRYCTPVCSYFDGNIKHYRNYSRYHQPASNWIYCSRQDGG